MNFFEICNFLALLQCCYLILLPLQLLSTVSYCCCIVRLLSIIPQHHSLAHSLAILCSFILSAFLALRDQSVLWSCLFKASLFLDEYSIVQMEEPFCQSRFIRLREKSHSLRRYWSPWSTDGIFSFLIMTHAIIYIFFLSQECMYILAQ